MTIFSWDNTKEYLAHVVAVLRIIIQKGLNVQCRKLAKTVVKFTGSLENLQKPNGPKGLSSKEDQEPISWSLPDPRDVWRSPKSSWWGCCQDVQASEKALVQWSADPMGSDYPQDAQAWLMGWSEWSNDHRKAFLFVNCFQRLSWAA